MRKGDEVEVVLRGRVSHVHPNAFVLSNEDGYSMSLGTENRMLRSVRIVEPEWREGDVVRDVNGDMRMYRKAGAASWVSLQTLTWLRDRDVPRPLTLLVRDGKAVQQ